MGWKSLQIWPIYQFSFRILPFPLLHLDHYYEEMCFFSYFIRVRFFICSLPYSSWFSSTWNLGLLFGHRKVSVFSQALLLVLDYSWSHNPPTYRRTVTPNWYWTHIVSEFGVDSSCITGACHCTQHTMFFNLCWVHIKVMNIRKCDGFLNWNDHEVTNQHNQCISSYTRNKYKK